MGRNCAAKLSCHLIHTSIFSLLLASFSYSKVRPPV
jgi:hypothetical protein